MPATIGTRGPVFVIIRPTSGAPMISMAVIGSSRTPVATGSRPCTFSRKNVMKNIAPNSENISVTVRTVPADRATERNSRSGSSGAFARVSRMMNKTSTSAAAPPAGRARTGSALSSVYSPLQPALPGLPIERQIPRMTTTYSSYIIVFLPQVVILL